MVMVGDGEGRSINGSDCYNISPIVSGFLIPLSDTLSLSQEQEARMGSLTANL